MGEAEAFCCAEMTQLRRKEPRVLGREVWLTNTVRMWQRMSCSVAMSTQKTYSDSARRISEQQKTIGLKCVFCKSPSAAAGEKVVGGVRSSPESPNTRDVRCWADCHNHSLAQSCDVFYQTNNK